MPRYFTHHWQNRNWQDEVQVNHAGRPLSASADTRFNDGRVSPGDVVYVVSMRDGQLYLGGRINVSAVVNRRRAAQFLGTTQNELWDAAAWIIDETRSGTPLNVRRRLAPEFMRQLRCMFADGETRGLFFDTPTHLNVQATRGIRELTPDSAALLDRVLAATDPIKVPAGEVLTVTPAVLAAAPPARRSPRPGGGSAGGADPSAVADDEPATERYVEGESRRVEASRRTRSDAARDACLAAHGTTCAACGFDFGATYGPQLAGLIEVHHLNPASLGKRRTDPARDLRPLSPNCHRVAHRRSPPYSVAAIKRLLGRAR